MTIKIGILGTADIAYRRFLPALTKCDCLKYVGIASRDINRTQKFIDSFGGVGYSSYDDLLADSSIDAVYIPLPPALHYEWGKKVLDAGKHLFMEKPFTTNIYDTLQLLQLAKEKGLVAHENYMFLYHKQLTKIKEIIANDLLGDIRLYSMSFGFPLRGNNDFRYNKELGGGALLDCGGYPIRLAIDLLGDTAKVVHSKLVQPKGFNVDLYGNAVMENDDGVAAQISFGMDNAYKCELEVWGSRAILKANRIFTSPVDYMVNLKVYDNFGVREILVGKDDQFLNSIKFFYDCILYDYLRIKNYKDINRISRLVTFIRNINILG